MRENKYRLVSKRDNFIYTYRGKPFILDINNIHTIEVLAESHAGGIIPLLYSVEQYTGIKDRNGKEVYEGDILESVERDIVFEVKWNDELWRLMLFSVRSKEFYDFDKSISELEITGNINIKESK